MQKLGSIDFSAPSTPYFWWGMSSLTFPSGIDAPGKHDSRLIRRRASELICEIIQTGKSVPTRGEISPNCSVYICASFAHLPDISIQPIPIRVIHVDGRDRFADVQRNISARTGQNQFMGVRESRLWRVRRSLSPAYVGVINMCALLNHASSHFLGHIYTSLYYAPDP